MEEAPIRIGIHLGQHMGHDDVAQAVLLEKVGLDRVWMGDGLWSPSGREPLVTAGALLQATSQVTVGVNVINVSTSLPQSLARQVGSLESLFPGRFILGLGIGYHKRLQRQAEWGYPVRTDEQRLAYFGEVLEYLTRFFTQEHVTFEGQFIQAKDAWVSPFVGRKPRFLIGGGRASILPFVAKYADLWDGVAIWNFGAREGETPEQYYRRKEQVLVDECAKVGRDPAAITRCVTVYAALAPTAAEAGAIADEQTPYIPARPTIIGTAQAAVDAIVAAYGRGAREVQIVPVTRGGHEAHLDFIRIVGEEVRPGVLAAIQARSTG